MSPIVILASREDALADEWEEQLPAGSTVLRLDSETHLPARAEDLNAIVVLDAAVELLYESVVEKCCAVYVGTPRSIPFEQAKLSNRFRVCLSYDESRVRLRELFPLLFEIAQKRSIVDLVASRNQREDFSSRSGRSSVASANELWDFLEGAVDGLESRERLLTEFRRASRTILRSSHCVFFIRDLDGFRADKGTSYFAASDPLVTYLESHPAVIDVSWRGLPPDPIVELTVRSRMALWGARMLAPVHDNARLLGVIAFGVREDGREYDDEDRNRAIQFARMFRSLFVRCLALTRLSAATAERVLGVKYFPGSLVLAPNDSVPRNLPLVVRDLIGEVRRSGRAIKIAPCSGQPFRASAGIVTENGGVWAYWEEASAEIHDAMIRERASRREVLRELAITLSHEVGNSLVSLATFRQLKGGKLVPEHLLETVRKDISNLEVLNKNLDLMQRIHESEPSVIDVRQMIQDVGETLGVKVEVGPDPIALNANRQLLEFAIVSLVNTLVENSFGEGGKRLSIKVRSTGSGPETIALVSLNGDRLELEGIIPESIDGASPNYGRVSVFLAKEILRLHYGGIHAGPGDEGVEILLSFKSW